MTHKAFLSSKHRWWSWVDGEGDTCYLEKIKTNRYKANRWIFVWDDNCHLREEVGRLTKRDLLATAATSFSLVTQDQFEVLWQLYK